MSQYFTTRILLPRCHRAPLLRRDLLLLSSPSADYDELVNAQDDLRRRMSTRLQPPQLLLLQGIAARPAMSGLVR